MASPRIVVLGAGGRLGAALAREWARDREVLAWGRTEGDLSDPEGLTDKVRRSGAGIVVNCAAMTNVDECERERDLAERVNTLAPARLAEACRGIGARCIHISTDYVFAGRTEGPVSEDTEPEPLSWYGRTKREGELGVLAAGADHAVVRVAWVFGPDRDCFVDKALQAALSGQAVEAVADKFSSPTYSLDAADALRALLAPGAPGGVFHLSQRGICSWRDWAQEAIDAAIELGFPVAHPQVKAIRLADLRLMTAPRPIHTALSCGKLEALAGRPMRPWQAAVRDYVRLLRDAGRLGAP